jgi:hypothetical protein
MEVLNDTLAAADLELDTETCARVAALTAAPAPATDRSEEPRQTGSNRSA